MPELPIIDLDFEGECNIAGIKKAYIIDVDDIDVFAELTDTPAVEEDGVLLVGSHILKAAKFWASMYSTVDKGNLAFNQEGERDFAKWAAEGIIFYPNTDTKAIAKAQNVTNRDLIILVEDNGNEDQFVQIGTKKQPARLVPAIDYGTERNGEKSTQFNIENIQCNLLIYRGVIPLEGGEIIS